MRPRFHAPRKIWLCFAIMAWSPILQAAPDLLSQITSAVTSNLKQSADYPIKQTVDILTAEQKLSELCPNPVITLSGNDQRLTGKRSVIAQCGTKRTFIQIAIQAEGTWWSAARAIKPGNMIQHDDIRPHTGSLDRLPADVVLSPQEIIGHVPTRLIIPGKPLTKNQLRKNWIIVSGQKVDVIAKGAGFQIHTSGKAMTNATEHDKLRVQTATGQILTGTATGAGQIVINMSR